MTYEQKTSRGSVSNADHGEDLILRLMFDVMKVQHPSYIDIGANDPFWGNNTSLLYATGGRGVNIEANPTMLAALQQHRPEDLNLCCAIGPERQIARPFYVSKVTALSSFHRDLVDDLDYEMGVQTWTLPDVVHGHFKGRWPDLLTIDIEGEDIAVLESCLPPSGDRPAVVCVEHMRMVQDYSQEWREFMPSRRYHLFFRTHSNMIWVAEEVYGLLL
jgi:FkbM family methyltransferase